MKKIIYAFLLSMGFFILLNHAKTVHASKCTINEVSYDLPKTIGFVNTYTISEFDGLEVIEELPTSFSSGVTMIVIENKSSCESISSYEYYFVKKAVHQLNMTNYTYHNILLDTYNGSSWSYSGIWPNFSTQHRSYSVSYTEISQTTTMYYYANVSTLTTMDQLKQYLIAEDNLDGDLSSSITVIEDNYSSNYRHLGEYPVRFSVTDSSNNISEFIINVIVVDAFAPTISGVSSIVSPMSNPLTVNDIKNQLSVVDNYDNNISIIVDEDYFTGHEYQKGNYNVLFSSTDSSSNKAIHRVVVTVADDVKPVIEGVSNIIKGNTSTFTKENVLEFLKSYDNIDGNLTPSIILHEDTYSLNSNIIGSYYLAYVVTDSSGNTCDPYYVNISVYDSIPPVFNVDENVIITDTSTIVTKEQIINLLIRTNQIKEEDVTKLTLIEDTYSLSHNADGDYTITYSLEKNGEIVNLSVNIKVNKAQKKKNSNKPVIFALSATLITFVGLFYIFKRFVFVAH